MATCFKHGEDGPSPLGSAGRHRRRCALAATAGVSAAARITVIEIAMMNLLMSDSDHVENGGCVEEGRQPAEIGLARDGLAKGRGHDERSPNTVGISSDTVG